MFASLLVAIVLLPEIVGEMAGGRSVYSSLHELTQRGNEPVDQQHDEQQATH